MTRNVARRFVTSLALAVVATGCAKVPYTHRSQFNLIPSSVMDSIGQQSYQEALAGQTVPNSGPDVTTLDRVAGRIANAANQPDFKWKYHIIDSSTVNAWCLPGGKIAVYSAILPVMQNEAGMAFVLGHETGHAIAHHGAERMSQQLAIMGGLAGLNAYLAGDKKMTSDQKNIMMAAIGLGAQVGLELPFSRMQESEADVIGEMLMSKAGYPPQESVKIWNRFDAITGGSTTPAFLSDHPPDANRKANLKDWMPQAEKRYERHKLAGDTTQAIWR